MFHTLRVGHFPVTKREHFVTFKTQDIVSIYTQTENDEVVLANITLRSVGDGESGYDFYSFRANVNENDRINVELLTELAVSLEQASVYFICDDDTLIPFSHVSLFVPSSLTAIVAGTKLQFNSVEEAERFKVDYSNYLDMYC